MHSFPRPLMSLLLATLACVAMGTATARPVAACIGGTNFDWAVAHAHGGILQARVDSAGTRVDFTTDLTLSHPESIRGDPPAVPRLHAVAGAICDQSADAGETVLVVFDIRGGQYPYPLPLFYVVAGSDALSPGVVAGALAALPSTDLAPSQPTPIPDGDSAVMPLSLVAGLSGFGVAMRQLRTRARLPSV